LSGKKEGEKQPLKEEGEKGELALPGRKERGETARKKKGGGGL